MTLLLHLLWLPVLGAAGTALVLSLPGWVKERSERQGRRRALTERLTVVYDYELRYAAVRIPAPIGPPATGLGWEDLPGDVAEDLTAAAEAFLGGTYRQHLQSAERVVPAWAWVNELAHGTLDDIEALAARGLWARGPEAIAASAAATISRQVRREGVSLTKVQERGLIPLEDRLAEEIPAAAAEDDVAHVLEVVLRRWLD